MKKILVNSTSGHFIYIAEQDLQFFNLSTHFGGFDFSLVKREKFDKELEKKAFQLCTATNKILPLTQFAWRSDRNTYHRVSKAIKQAQQNILTKKNRLENMKNISMLMVGTIDSEFFYDPYSGKKTEFVSEFHFRNESIRVSTYDLHHYNYMYNTSMFKSGEEPSKKITKSVLTSVDKQEFIFLFALERAAHTQLHKAHSVSNLLDWVQHWESGKGKCPFFLESKANFDKCIEYMDVNLDYDKVRNYCMTTDVYYNKKGYDDLRNDDLTLAEEIVYNKLLDALNKV